MVMNGNSQSRLRRDVPQMKQMEWIVKSFDRLGSVRLCEDEPVYHYTGQSVNVVHNA